MQPCLVLVDSTGVWLFHMIGKESFRSSIIKIAEMPTRLLLEPHERLQEFLWHISDQGLCSSVQSPKTASSTLLCEGARFGADFAFRPPREKAPENVTPSHLWGIL